MPEESRASIAQAKAAGDHHEAPLRLMTQFLRAVSESRMENALALAQTSRSCSCSNIVGAPDTCRLDANALKNIAEEVGKLLRSNVFQ